MAMSPAVRWAGPLLSGPLLCGAMLGAVLTGCTGGGANDPVAPATAASAAPAPTSFAATGCPVTDTAFCARAATAATALATGDTAGLFALATPETFTCDTMPAGTVAGCRPGAVRDGYAVYTVASKISVLDAAAYRSRLTDLFGRVDAGFADEHGTGRTAVRGVGTCGPDDPRRRSYHLSFTTALRGADGRVTQRWLGSLEFVMRDGTWAYALMFFDTVTAWRQEHPDPFRQTACGNVRPWLAVQPTNRS